MPALMVFIDCEFTDFIDIDLISIALVCEDGREFYAERTDFRLDECSDFVRVAVLPLLGQVPEAAMTRKELEVKLRGWLSELPEVVIACDSNHDRDLFVDAVDYQLTPNVVGWIGLDGFSDEEAEAFYNASTAYHDEPGHPWHHALHDARAHCVGWQASKQAD